MRALGRASVDELGRGDVVLPEGFELALGADGPRAARRAPAGSAGVRRSSTTTKGRKP